MKTQNIHDERVVVQRRKVNSEAYGILMIVLFVAIVVQQLLLDAPFEQYAVEVICFFGMCIYMVIRYITLGLNIYGYGEEKWTHRIPLVNSIVTGMIVTAINGVLNYSKYADHYEANLGYFFATLVITFVSATLSIFVILSYINYLNKKKQAKIQQQLDDDEDEDEK